VRGRISVSLRRVSRRLALDTGLEVRSLVATERDVARTMLPNPSWLMAIRTHIQGARRRSRSRAIGDDHILRPLYPLAQTTH
jgi:hypothetical protein